MGEDFPRLELPSTAHSCGIQCHVSTTPGQVLCSGPWGWMAPSQDCSIIERPNRQEMLWHKELSAMGQGVILAIWGEGLRKDECTGGPGHLTLVLVRGQARVSWAVQHGRPVGRASAQAGAWLHPVPSELSHSSFAGRYFPHLRISLQSCCFSCCSSLGVT